MIGRRYYTVSIRVSVDEHAERQAEQPAAHALLAAAWLVAARFTEATAYLDGYLAGVHVSADVDPDSDDDF